MSTGVRSYASSRRPHPRSSRRNGWGQVSWRSRFAKQASRFLEPGERIQSVFATAVRDNYGAVLYFPAFVVTDRAIIEIDRQFVTGRLTEVVARHPRNIRLG